tara:strand:+ start:306 stop:944 length:639 start_codon:yes stop_codon:yes gene_type:complete
MSKNEINIIRPFGPSIGKVAIPIELVDKLNNYVDKIIHDKEKSDQLDFGNKLAGNVKQEFIIEKDFLESSGFLKFLAFVTSNWIKFSDAGEIKKFKIISAWIVRQFKNEYNPLHYHGGHISGVGYLKLPKNFGGTTQSKKATNQNGQIALVHGSKMFNSKSIHNIVPKVGEFYLFPNYLMHTVYPFFGNDEERRSVSFNATIDEDIYNVYGS